MPGAYTKQAGSQTNAVFRSKMALPLPALVLLPLAVALLPTSHAQLSRFFTAQRNYWTQIVSGTQNDYYFEAIERPSPVLGHSTSPIAAA